MRALLFERNVPRYAAAVLAGRLGPGRGASVGPLRLADVDEPEPPGAGWVRVRPRLSGICGSDLATIDGHSSRYFEPIVSFPFVPGHEVVGDLDDGRRVVVQPVLACAPRGIDPPCPSCAAGQVNRCQRIAFGDLEPGLQTGYCADTGGGWSVSLVAHESQLHLVPEAMSDEAAVLVEPTACAVHAARSVPAGSVAVIGAGTLGLLTIAALRDLDRPVGRLLATAKHPEQRRLARDLGADLVVEPDALGRAVRSATRSLRVGGQLTGGIDNVVDCVGSEASIRQALSVVAPGGTVVVVGMPATVSIDLTTLWHREISLRGCYAYDRSDFEAAFDLVAAAGLERLLSATYPLDRYRDAIEHAAAAGTRGAVKIAFDLRSERNR
ncbi:MAG TPA: zinc-binding dehydrogenase [Acidimicrobiales bacterium]|nr:zinc-binding dehydrogenase [Acidimicrobiales bacterium]